MSRREADMRRLEFFLSFLLSPWRAGDSAAAHSLLAAARRRRGGVFDAYAAMLRVSLP